MSIVDLPSIIDVQITEPVLNKIKFLCSKISQVEWSGILFYKVDGDFNTGKFKCVIEDLYPMDKGTSGYTEYEFSEDFIKYRMNNLDTLECNIGHIHSHNNMSTFFSGTDLNELRDNVSNHNYYLSLIVNNKLDMTAKIAFSGNENVITEKTIKFTGDDGLEHSIVNKSNLTKDVVFSYNCNIIFNNLAHVDSTFESRVDTIIKESNKAKVTTTFVKPSVNHEAMCGTLFPINTYDGVIKDEDEEDLLVEDKVDFLVTDALACEYETKDTFIQVINIANKQYLKSPKEYIIHVGNFFRSLFPFYFKDKEVGDLEIMPQIYAFIDSIYDEELISKEFRNDLINELKDEV